METAIEVLKKERAALREKARWHNRHRQQGVGVRARNVLLQCARLTIAILALQDLA